MVDFNSLSEGEKFAFSKKFLIEYRVIKNLKPSLKEEKDILLLVAEKCYDGDVRVLENCIRFMYGKTKFDNLEEVNLDDAEMEYAKSLEKQSIEQDKKLKEKFAQEGKKQAEYAAATQARNAAIVRLEDAQSKENFRKISKWLIIGGAVMAGCLLLLTYGGLVGVVNGLLAALTELSFAQVATLGIVGYWGFYKGGFLTLGGKIKGMFASRADKREKKLKEIKDQKAEQDKKQKNIADQLSAIKAEKEALQLAVDQQKSKTDAERTKLERYERYSNFDRMLRLNEVELKDYFNLTKEKMSTPEDMKKLEDWHRLYLGSLYYGAYTGAIKTRDDFKAIVEQAKAKFGQLSNPLYVNTDYTDENIKLGTDPRTNKPLEELYEAI